MTDDPLTTDDKRQVPGEVLRVPLENWSRVVGYLRPVSSWHKAKQQEMRDRKVFRVEDDDGTPG